MPRFVSGFVSCDAGSPAPDFAGWSGPPGPAIAGVAQWQSSCFVNSRSSVRTRPPAPAPNCPFYSGFWNVEPPADTKTDTKNTAPPLLQQAEASSVTARSRFGFRPIYDAFWKGKRMQTRFRLFRRGSRGDIVSLRQACAARLPGDFSAWTRSAAPPSQGGAGVEAGGASGWCG